MDDKDIVSSIFLNLAAKVGQDRFELWFGAQVRLTIGIATATVEVPNRFYQDWLRRNFRRDVEAACQEILGRAVAVEFRIDPALDSKSADSKLAPRARRRTLSPGNIRLRRRQCRRPDRAWWQHGNGRAGAAQSDQGDPAGNGSARNERVHPKVRHLRDVRGGKRQQTRICRRRKRGSTAGEDQPAVGLRIHRHGKNTLIGGRLE